VREMWPATVPAPARSSLAKFAKAALTLCSNRTGPGIVKNDKSGRLLQKRPGRRLIACGSNLFRDLGFTPADKECDKFK
jgi:hypothetical protein